MTASHENFMRPNFSFDSQRPSVTIVMVIAALCFCAPTFAAEDTIGIAAAVPFAEGINVPEAVRNECHLGEQVSTFLQQFAPDVKVAGNPKEGRYLDMSITEVFASGGGAWSGPKWMEVKGTLLDNGTAGASFRAKRFSTGGAFGGFKGTCSIIGRCTKTIAKDIATWLKAPVDGAELGDAK